MGGFDVLAGRLAFTTFLEKCGDTPKFCGKPPSFRPLHFSRSDHEHSFLGIMFDLLLRPSSVLFGEIKTGRGTTRRKKTLSQRKPYFQGTGSLLCGSCGQRGVSLRAQESVFP